MAKVIGWLKREVPQYLWLVLAIWFGQNAAVYYLARIIENLYGIGFHDLSLPLDHQMPLIPAFILIYCLSFVSWYIGYWLIARKDIRKTEIIFGAIFAKVLCFIIYVCYPTSMERPEVTGGGLMNFLLRFIYFMDQPNNLFPSIHCLENWLVWRGMIGCDHLSKPVKWGFFVFMLLVFASTLLVHQHVLLDIPSAIVVGEIGIWLSRKLRMSERYAAWWSRRMA